MEQFNKALSFILGLIVVAVFIVVASGKFNIKGLNVPKANTASNSAPSVTPQPTSKPWFSFGQPKATPTPTIKTVATTQNRNLAVEQNQQDPNYHSYINSNAPTTIPNTGVPIVLFPLLGSSFLTGIFMKKAGKKD